jgi:MraZ protein
MYVVQSGAKWWDFFGNGVSNLFYGEYIHSLDPKGRIIIPSKFREELGTKFIITKGLDGCLFVYPQNEWIRIEDKLKALPFTDRDVRSFVRFFFSGASESELDKQGRVLIPSILREYASITREICVIGVSSRVELWDKQKWDEYNNKENLNPDLIADKMSMLGI